MPRKNKSKLKDGCVVHFHTVVSSALAANVFAVALNPSDTNLSATRLPAEADTYAHFRVLSVKARLHPITRTAQQVLGYVGGVQDTPPATLSAMGELVSYVP